MASPSSASTISHLTTFTAPAKRVRPKDEIIASPAKKQSRWSATEDAEIIRLKESGMKWGYISQKLRGRSPISCRLHYQNYLEHRSEKKREWDEESRRTLPFTQVFEGHHFTPPSSNHEDSCTPGNAYSQQHPFPEASDETFNHQRASPSTEPGHHPHSCFRCETPRAIGTCDDWKKHMREHETVFPCMQCEDSDSYTRKATLVKHLFVSHNMSDLDASAKADTWRKTVEKKYFSCGFCVSLFYNIADQLNHIDIEHFRRHQDISGWNISKVIKGLIQQPGVENLFWQHVFGAGYPKSQDFAWNDSVAKDLQRRLELREESAADLATAATSQVIWTEIPQDSDEASVTGGFINPHMEKNILLGQDRATVMPAYSSSITTNTSSGTTIAHEVSQGPSSALEWEISNKMDISSFYTQSTIPQIQTQLPYRSALASYDQTNPGTQPIFQQSESSNSAQSYTAPPVTSIRSPCDDGCPHGHGPGAPGNLAFTPVNKPSINSPLHTQKNFARDDKGGKEILPGFTEFVMGVMDLARRGK